MDASVFEIWMQNRSWLPFVAGPMLQARGHGAGDAPDLLVCRAAAGHVVVPRVYVNLVLM